MVGRSLEDFPASAVGINIRANSVMSSHSPLCLIADFFGQQQSVDARQGTSLSSSDFLHGACCRGQFWSPRLPSQHFLSISHPSAGISLLSCCDLLLQREEAPRQSHSVQFCTGSERLCLDPPCDGDSGNILMSNLTLSQLLSLSP